MADHRPSKVKNLDGYGVPAIDWQRVEDTLRTQVTQAPGTGGPGRHTSWLTTIGGEGEPHVVPLGTVTVDGSWYFTSGPNTTKSRNLARDPRCVISIATHPFDLVMRGHASRITDSETLEAVVAAFNEGGWPARVEGDALVAEYSAPSAGPPPWYLYRFVPQTVFAYGTAEPYGATRFDL